MSTATYNQYRGQLQTYFDSTARDAWERLTSDAPVSRIRATVRAGREEMHTTLLSWLPDDLTGRRILDAGCGTGAVAVELAKRGAHVIAVDVSAGLINVARERSPAGLKIDWYAGDMLNSAFGSFDHVIAMDSLIHYPTADIVTVLSELGERTRHSMLFTFAPRTPALMLMLGAGKLFPRKDRSPAIQPVGAVDIRGKLGLHPKLRGWRTERDHLVSGGFYKSHAMELRWG
jgi:magnesium-protoporphyrin O-methyltransferase